MRTTLFAITRVTSNFLLSYPTLLGFEKALLVIAWAGGEPDKAETTSLLQAKSLPAIIKKSKI